MERELVCVERERETEGKRQAVALASGADNELVPIGAAD